MKNYRYLPLGLLTLVLAACSVETSESQPDISKIEKEVKEVFDNYVNQVNTEGIEEVHTYFSDDERFYWIEDGVIQYPDKASLISGLEKFTPSVASVKMEVSEKRVDVIDQDHAMLLVQYVEKIILKSAYELTLDGAMTILMKRQGNDWKFLSGHSSVKKPRNNSN